jgi:hypothetical protein
MKRWISNGFHAAWRQPFAVLTLFVYNLIWGVVIYKLLHEIIVPLLHRYPGQAMSKEASQLFWIESQFQLTKTDLLHEYLWWAAALLLLRMLLTPALNAGLYYSLHHTSLNAGYRFFEGVRKLTLPFLGYYALQMILMLAPLYWVIMEGAESLSHRFTYSSIAADMLPVLAIYAVYGYIVQLAFMYAQFGKASGGSPWEGIYTMFKGILPAVVISLSLLLVTLLLSAAAMSVSMIWAGFLTLLLYQAHRLIHMFCKVWSVAAQYNVWLSKTRRQ